ncbi:Transcription factor MYC/MYB N-terminal [Dillenia turbinata]|uniref:Transcription factor MYC/MYB N-terminal n=1 Tax=Dillenia turbinata TaxID=194707 RepID=A0AAN8ZR13_9MAGN
MGLLLLSSAGPPIKRRAGLRIKQAGRDIENQMGCTVLTQFLMSLCVDSQWDYAVLWKLNHQTPLLLTWEDGYCDIPRSTEALASILNNEFLNEANEISSFSYEPTVQAPTSDGCLVQLAMSSMMAVQYAWGVGVVGKVAHMGCHCWVLSEDVLSGEFNYDLVPECPEEWLLQFAVGINTILLLPILPLGVLQLGSLRTVPEDMALVAQMRDKFIALQSIPGYSVPSDWNLLVQSPSLPIFIPVEGLQKSSVIKNNLQTGREFDELKAVDIGKLAGNKLSASNQVIPLLKFQDALEELRKGSCVVVKSEYENDFGLSPIDLSEFSRTVYIPTKNSKQSEMIETDRLRFSHLEEVVPFSPCNEDKSGLVGEYHNGIMNLISGEAMKQQFLEDEYDNDSDHISMNNVFSFPMDCELHKALGSGFHRPAKRDRWNSLSRDNANDRSSLVDCMEQAAWDCSGWFSEKGDAEQLLEAMVAKVQMVSEDTYDKSSSMMSDVTSLGEYTALSVPGVQVVSSVISGCKNDQNGSLTSVSSCKGMNTKTDEEQPMTGLRHMHPTKGTKPSTLNKRRAKPGDSQKPRPRDRQLIQDRVKELRELIPDGAKCSIDGLLDRTIKHMLFLRNITNQSEKLKQWEYQEGAGLGSRKTSEVKHSRRTGTSWAMELGKEFEVCPIVVEDLECPGHMLIEMLCNEHGLFLEIAQVIRRLELTILKGVMKIRSNKTWAHFVVEAYRGFHRLDIFWPLMRLLQWNCTSASSGKHRNATNAETSLASAGRPKGVRDINRATFSWLSASCRHKPQDFTVVCSMSGLLTIHGATALVWILSFAHSDAKFLVS